MQAISVTDPTQVAQARRSAVALANGMGFTDEEAGRAALVVTELATNLIKHAGGGELLIGTYGDDGGTGVECYALDKGTGIADVALSSRDGHSTAGSPGLGLGAVLRQSHLVDIYSRPGSGTAILARLERGRPLKRGGGPSAVYGAINLSMPGEESCGDAWCVRRHPAGLRLLVSDGLGHGPLAAAASHAAVRVFLDSDSLAPGDMLAAMHPALRATRGAAISIAHIHSAGDAVQFAGIGNVAGTVVSSSGMRRMVSHNGTVGHSMKRIQEFAYPLDGPSLVVLCSDGLGTAWTLDRYPGLSNHHPGLIAGVLYRDFARGRDDVTVLVAKASASEGERP
jgi:anti-sigma regulatory factor (Ser/Thr protein kinase)